MLLRRWGMLGLLGIAALSLWLLLAGTGQLLGIDTGPAGMVLLVSAAWMSLYALQRMPRGQLDNAVSPGEARAWVGFGFTAVAAIYFLAKLHVFQGADALRAPDANAVGRNLVMLLIAWTVLSSVLASRWQGEVLEDERDRRITAQAGGLGRGALTVAVIGLALMLGFSPAARLAWATHFMIANLLVFMLVASCLVEYAATVIAYWRDRH